MRDFVFNQMMDDFWVYPKLTRIQDKRDYADSFFQFLQKENTRKSPTNLYIHVPFCDSYCVFCPYYKQRGKAIEKNRDLYVDALVREIKKYGETPYLRHTKIDSIHFGGGNPLLLELGQLERILRTVGEVFDFKIQSNITIEGSINAIKSVDVASGLKNMGIDRISFGIQTFDPVIREKMKIKSTLQEIYEGVSRLQNTNYPMYCIDMMYNMPDQSMDILYQDLEKVTALRPYHIDMYNMAVFPNTNLDKLIKQKGTFSIVPSNERQIEMYDASHQWLMGHGYRQLLTNTYSQYQEQVHIGDYNYLSNCNVIGIGVSSRGYIDGYAYKNVCTVEEYLEEMGKGHFPADLAQTLSVEQHNDRRMVFFPILMKIERKKIEQYDRYEERIEHLISRGLAEFKGDNLCLTPEGVKWSGNISTIFMGDQVWSTYLKIFLASMRDKTNPYNEDYIGTALDRSGNE